ncbi:MAG: GNAT family N-acetyltransferase [Mycobacteriales bacterium]
MTATVTLRGLTRDDVAVMAGWTDRESWPDVNELPWTGRTVEQALARWDARTPGGDDVRFGVEAEGRLVGSVSLWKVDTYNSNAHLGIELAPQERGKGYGSAACRAIVEYAFVDRGLHRVQLEVLATNERAVRAYLAAGFVEEGRLRESAWLRGRFVDKIIMSVLNPNR